MDLRLEGRTALVTGASYGLGFACAEALAREGVKVAICSREEQRLRDAQEQLSRDTAHAVAAFRADLTHRADVDRLVAEATAALGGIDILVLSTGHPPTFPFSRATDKDWQRGIDLVMQPTIKLTRALLPHMIARGYGRFVYIGSIFGREPEASSVIQSTLRTGLNAFSKCIATEYAEQGITANVLCPGYFDTPLVRELAGQYARDRNTSLEVILDEWRATSPVKRFGRPEDLGAFVAFLASPRAEFLTGTSITFDGGALKGY